MPYVAHAIGPEPWLFAERAGPETIQAILDRTAWEFGGLPTIVMVGGEPVLRRDWPTRILPANDAVTFVSFPKGGGGLRSALAITALIAIAAATIFLTSGAGAPFVAGLTGLSTSAGVTVGSATVSYAALAAYGTAAVVGVGGGLLVNHFLLPKPATSKDASFDPPPSLISAAGNVARPDGTIPVTYGEFIVYPDLAAQSWSEFHNNKQRIYTLFCIGQGEYEFHKIRADDTVIWEDGEVVADFSGDVKVEIVEPGADIDLFPFAPVTADEVSSAVLPGDAGDEGNFGDWVGPFIANAAGTEAKHLIVDYMFPGGLFEVNQSNGNLTTRELTVQAEYQEVDDEGAPVGGWTQFLDRTFSKRTREAQRFTTRVDVSPGRYQVRMRRNKKELADEKGFDQAVWYALRAHLVAPRHFPDTTMLAVAWDVEDAGVAETATRRVNAILTRKLWVWDGEDWVKEASRSAEWAAVDIFTDETYGFGASRDDVDAATFKYYADQAEELGDTFNHTFRSRGKVLDALRTVLEVRRSQPVILGHKLTMVRDEPRAAPTMLLTDREIRRGSFELKVKFHDEESADDVVIEFLNRQTWEADDVRATLKDSTSEAPARIRKDGVTDRSQAWRIARYTAANNRYRRMFPGLDTLDYDGRLLLPGDLVRLTSEIPDRWGQTAQIVREDVANRRLTLEPAPDWSGEGTQDYIEIRTAKGRAFGPVQCSQGTKRNIAVLNAGDLAAVEAAQGMSLAQALARKAGADLPSAVIGREGRQSRDAVVLAFEPRGSSGRLSMMLDDPRVHTADGTEVEPTPVEQGEKPPNRPVIYRVNARLKQRGNDSTIEVSWTAAYGATHYLVEVSSEEDDSDRSWTRLWRGTDTEVELPADEIATKVRVAAVGKHRGPWLEQAIEFPAYLTHVPVLTVTPFLETGGSKDRGPGIKVEWAKPPRQGYAGIVISWWPTADATRVKTKTLRGKSRVSIDVFEGIRREVAYTFQAKFLFRGGLEGDDGLTYEATALASFDAGTAPVPNIAGTTITATTIRSDSGTERSSFRLQIPADADARIRGVVVEFKKAGDSDAAANERAFRDYLSLRITEGIHTRQSYQFRLAFLFDGENRGNFSAWSSAVAASDSRADDPDDVRTENNLFNHSFERLEANGFPKGWLATAGTWYVGEDPTRLYHRSRYLAKDTSGEGRIVLDPANYFPAKPGQTWTAAIRACKFGSPAFTSVAVIVRYYDKDKNSVQFSADTVPAPSTVYDEIAVELTATHAAVAYVGMEFSVVGQTGTGTLAIDYAELQRQKQRREIKDNSVNDKKLEDEAVTTPKIAANAVSRVASVSDDAGTIDQGSFTDIATVAFTGKPETLIIASLVAFSADPANAELEFRLIVSEPGEPNLQLQETGPMFFANANDRRIIVLQGVFVQAGGAATPTLTARIAARRNTAQDGSFEDLRISCLTLSR